MKKLSVKMKVTLWYTALMTLLVAIILAFLFSVGGRLVKVAARDRLIEMAMKGYDDIEFEDDRLEFDEDVYKRQTYR